MEPATMGWIIGVTLGLFFIAIETLFMRALFRAPLPHNFLVVSGRQYHQGGQVRGFRIEDRLTILMPIMEQCLEMDGACWPCTVVVRDAYLKDGDRLTLEWFALVRITREISHRHEAVERFAGQPAASFVAVATETLEGTARSLLATLGATEVAGPQLEVNLIRSSKESFGKLGLEVVHLSRSPSGKEA